MEKEGNDEILDWGLELVLEVGEAELEEEVEMELLGLGLEVVEGELEGELEGKLEGKLDREGRTEMLA